MDNKRNDSRSYWMLSKNIIATLFAGALMIGCNSSPKETAAPQDVVDTADSLTAIGDTNAITMTDPILCENFIPASKEVIDSIISFGDGFKELSDSIGYYQDGPSILKNYFDTFASLMENTDMLNKTNFDALRIIKEEIGDKIYFFTIPNECNSKVLYGYLVYEMQEDSSYKLVASKPLIFINEQSVNSFGMNIINLRNSGVLLVITRYGGDETVCGHSEIDYLTIDGDCLYSGIEYDGCSGYDVITEKGDTVDGGDVSSCSYVLDSINFTDGYPDLTVICQRESWIGEKKEFSQSTDVYKYSKAENIYVIRK